jgi:diketogulonate reductase-like aldo/keto reductase
LWLSGSYAHSLAGYGIILLSKQKAEFGTLINYPGVKKTPLNSKINRQQRYASWKGLIRAKQNGLCRFIGVSNFNVAHLSQLVEDMHSEGIVGETPYCNQFELHPLCSQEALRAYCSSKNILVQAYSSLGSGSTFLLNHPVVALVASEAGLTNTEVLLRWAVEQRISVIPKSRDAARLRQNLVDCHNSVLTIPQMEMLNGINEDRHFCWNPDTVL